MSIVYAPNLRISPMSFDSLSMQDAKHKAESAQEQYIPIRVWTTDNKEVDLEELLKQAEQDLNSVTHGIPGDDMFGENITSCLLSCICVRESVVCLHSNGQYAGFDRSEK